VAFLEVSAYLLWIVGGFVLVAALILFAVSVRLWYDGPRTSKAATTTAG
jgi:hypothetical protein